MTAKKEKLEEVEESSSAPEAPATEGSPEPSAAPAKVATGADSSLFKGADGRTYRRVHERVGGGWKDYCILVG